jgi:hypothetical protein
MPGPFNSDPFPWDQQQPATAAPATTAPPAAPNLQTGTPSLPTITMDATTQKQILHDQQRDGWIAQQPAPDVQLQMDPVTGTPTATVKGWNMVISDPKTGATQTVKLTYNPAAIGKGAAWAVSEGPGDLPKVTGTQPKTPNEETTVIGGVVYGPDPNNPNGPFIARAIDQTTQAKAQADAAQSLASAGLSTAQAQALMSKTPAEIASTLATTNLTAAQQQQVLNNVKIANAKLESDIGVSTAQAAQANAQAGSLASAAGIAQQKAPGEMALTNAQTVEALKRAGYSDAQIQQTLLQTQQAKAPTTEQPQQGLYIYQRDPNTGQMTPQINENFIPKTQADVAARVGQLQQEATAKRDELQGKISATYTAQQAAADFDKWWTSTVEPQKTTLAAAQTQVGQEQQRLQEEQARANYATAQTAGATAVDAQKAMLPYAVGPGFGSAINQLMGQWQNPSMKQPDIDYSKAFTFKAPDFNQISQQATAQALAHISPTAAAIAGTGQPQLPQQAQGMDIAQMLQSSAYRPTGGAPMMTPGQPVQPVPSSMANTTMNVGAMPGAVNGMQSTPLPWTGGGPMPFGAINPNPWPNYVPSY